MATSTDSGPFTNSSITPAACAVGIAMRSTSLVATLVSEDR